jgi:hypothetical protein
VIHSIVSFSASGVGGGPRKMFACAEGLALRMHATEIVATRSEVASPNRCLQCCKWQRPATTSRRDFVSWRLSAAGRWSTWLDRRCRRLKTCTTADSCTAAKVPHSIISSARPSSEIETVKPSAHGDHEIDDEIEFGWLVDRSTAGLLVHIFSDGA